MSAPIERKGSVPEPLRRTGMGRFDFSRASQRATNEEGSNFTDRHGNNVITDKAGNRRLVRNGEAQDLSYLDKYEVDVHTDPSTGLVTADVHMDQDPVIDKILEGAAGMLALYDNGDSSKVRELMSGDLAEKFEKEIATNDKDRDKRIASLRNLVQDGERWRRSKAGESTPEDLDWEERQEMIRRAAAAKAQQPAPPPQTANDRFLDKFTEAMGERRLVETGYANTRPRGNFGRRIPNGALAPEEFVAPESSKTTGTRLLCNSCDGVVSTTMKFCPECGAALR